MPAEGEQQEAGPTNASYPGESDKVISEITYDSPDGLMAKGPDALHEHLAQAVETSLGRELPQTEIRFRHVSLSAEIQLANEQRDTPELPTLWNEFRKGIASMLCLRGTHAVTKNILQDVSGTFKPGTITLVMGQPGSGKSALMKLLAGRFPLNKNVTFEGDITYNGKSREELKDRLPQLSSYVTQRNYLSPTLTVKETLEFAHKFTGYDPTVHGKDHFSYGDSTQNSRALDVAHAMHENHPDVVLRQLGLTNCQDTIVGDEMTRGVSGGEKKRVTTGEMQFGLKNISLMDEITTGLDSAAAYDIVNTQRSIARRLKKTVVISLLQPTPEVFDLFDDVMIFTEGRVMYFGPREEAVSYFRNIGFSCPPERDPADFLMDLNTNQQKHYEVQDESITPPRSGWEFAERFRASKYYRAVEETLDSNLDPQRKEDADKYMSKVPKYWQTFWPSTWTVVKRELVLLSRNPAVVRGHMIMMVVMGLLLSSTFYQVDTTKVQVVMGVIFQAVLFVSLGMASQIPTFMKARDVFYKQRGSHFFRTLSYVLAVSISQLPQSIFDALSFGSLIYWMCGLTAKVELYLVYLVVLLTTNLALCSWFFFLVTVSPNTNVAMPVAMMSINVFVIFAGFVIPKGQIPDYFIWLYWLSPVSWSIRSLAVNEYRYGGYDDMCTLSSVKDINFCESEQTAGEYLLNFYEVPTEKHWVFTGIIFLVALYVGFMTLSTLVLEFNRYEAPENVSFTEEEQNQSTGKKNSSDGGVYQALKSPTTSQNGSDEAVMDVKPVERHFTPVNLAFKDLWYTVQVPGKKRGEKSTSLDLLKGVTGYALPGTMTALMGSTGAGKTTLMDVIAGRKTGGKIGGDILLNGHPASALAIQRATGYCEQMDIHASTTTFREALVFSAFLRQSADVPDSVKFDSVNECLELLDMHDVADQIVRGGSTEQMKRLTIGVELAAQPSILFLDEPTSGLDAHSAKVIMDGVRNVAKSGRTIVCTIHQPSSEVFLLFDKVLLLQRGGYMVYFGDLGENCRTLVNYFSGMDHTQPMTKGYNPANWMLECIGAGVDNNIADDVDFEAAFNNSELHKTMENDMEQEGVMHPSPDMPEVTFDRKRASESSVQAKMLLKRFMDQYWRTPTYNLTRIVVALILAVLFGLLFLGNDYNTYQGINAGVGVIFMSTLFTGMIAFNNILSISCEERAVFYRERSAQTYNALWYFVGTTVAEIPYTYLSVLLFTVIFYPMVGFQGFTNAVIYWLSSSTLVLLQTYMGQALAFAFPTEEVAHIVGVLLNIFFILFMGFNPPAESIPAGYKWVYTIAPHRYALSTLVAVVFGDCENPSIRDPETGAIDMPTAGDSLGCQIVQNGPEETKNMTIKEFVEVFYGANHDEITRDFLILVAYIIGFRIIALVSLRYINHQKR